jgi:hypothetical protein
MILAEQSRRQALPDNSPDAGPGRALMRLLATWQRRLFDAHANDPETLSAIRDEFDLARIWLAELDVFA